MGGNFHRNSQLIKGMPEKLHKLAECMNESHCEGFDSAQPPVGVTVEVTVERSRNHNGGSDEQKQINKK